MSKPDILNAKRIAGPARAVALFLVGSALFAAAYCLAPLYYSNQNQYFLHGLAGAGDGTLGDDWLANTRDPTPAFSALVTWTARRLPAEAFYVYHALLLGAYAASLLAVFGTLAGPETAARRWPVFVALFVLAHAGVVRWLSYRLVGFDYAWFLQAGLAGQYVLGAFLQPSAFGVLLVAAVALFARDRPLAAAVCIGLAALMHSTYLLPGALLTLGFQAQLLRERRFAAAAGLGLIALALVLPAVAYVRAEFLPTTPRLFLLSQDILSNFRIPHHTRIDLWLDWVAFLQVAWVVLALWLLRGTRLFVMLAVPVLLAAGLTMLQGATRNDTLALLFPWRISAVLVPVATAVILTRLATLPHRALGGRAAWAASAVVVAAAVGAGVWISATRSAFRTDDREAELLAFVRETASPGDVYFVPVSTPNRTNPKRGSLSSDFMPQAAKKQGGQVIQPDLQRFRLHAGAPIYVDFKSIPYRDVEVIEWRDRVDAARRVGRQLSRGRVGESVAELRRRGVTHIVWPATEPLRGPGLEEVFAGAAYRVYRLKDEG